MPTVSSILGFSNKWYPDGFHEAITYKLDDDSEILIFSLPYFLAAKWEAHKSRGGNDLRTSRDFEDMVYIFENGYDFDEQLLAGPSLVRDFLREELSPYIQHADFEEGIYCHMEGTKHGADPTQIIKKIKKCLNLE